MAITFFWRCEGTTLSGTDDLPGADTSAAATGSPEISATAALVGSNGILINANNEYYSLNSEDAVLNSAAGAIGFWFRSQSFAADSDVIRLRFNSGDSSDWVGVVTSTTTNNHLVFLFRTSGVGYTVLDSTYAISNDTTYFVIVKWDNAANDRRIEIYNSSGTLLQADEDLATSWTAPAEAYPVTDGMAFGGPSSSINFYLDNIFIGTAWADGDAFLTNRSITSYTAYGAGGGTVALSGSAGTGGSGTAAPGIEIGL